MIRQVDDWKIQMLALERNPSTGCTLTDEMAEKSQIFEHQVPTGAKAADTIDARRNSRTYSITGWYREWPVKHKGLRC